MKKVEITEAIADMVRQETPDLTSRLEYQEEALQEVECIDRRVGHWVQEYDLKYLFASLSLEDADFAEKFPLAKPVGKHGRLAMIDAIEKHLEHCGHCSLKRGYDLELDSRIKEVCREKSEILLQLLEEEEEGACSEEGEHVRLELVPEIRYGTSMRVEPLAISSEAIFAAELIDLRAVECGSRSFKEFEEDCLEGLAEPRGIEPLTS